MLQILSILVSLIGIGCYNINAETTYDFLVIGAGPAGISTIGVLLDNGIAGKKIAWVDSSFNVGRIGSCYSNVPSNTKVRGTLSFIKACDSFAYSKQPAFQLEQLNSDSSCFLSYFIEPLQWLSNRLREEVYSLQTTIIDIKRTNNIFIAETIEKTITTKKIILATGAHPKKLNYPNLEEISLEDALNPAILSAKINPDDTVAVFGGSHSAILTLRNLAMIEVKQIINFYKKPLLYAVDMGSWYLYENSGLKEVCAQWAKWVLEKNPPLNLKRYKNTSDNIASKLPLCNKIIYAIGFEQNEVPGFSQEELASYDTTTGMIIPNVFGIGIGFPRKYTDPFGNQELQIGITDFMAQAKRSVKLWINSLETSKNKLCKKNIKS